MVEFPWPRGFVLGSFGYPQLQLLPISDIAIHVNPVALHWAFLFTHILLSGRQPDIRINLQLAYQMQGDHTDEGCFVIGLLARSHQRRSEDSPWKSHGNSSSRKDVCQGCLAMNREYFNCQLNDLARDIDEACLDTKMDCSCSLYQHDRFRIEGLTNRI